MTKTEFSGAIPADNSAGRQYYLDWLRALGILLVFFAHTGKIFDYHTTVLFNSVPSPVLSIFREFVLLWIIPFFFTISGAAIFLSSRFQKAGAMIKSRVRRILVPSIIVGTLVINPPYIYMEKLFSGKTSSGFFQWYPSFFEGFYLSGNGNFAPWGMGTHLWYLQLLFIFTLILFPFFIRSPKRGRSMLQKASSFFENPWTLSMLFIPVSAAAAVFEYVGLGSVRIMGGWDLISYMLFLIYGYLLFCNKQTMETVKKYSFTFFAVALLFTVLYLDAHFGIHLKIPSVTRHDLTNNELLPSNRSIWAIVQAVRGLLAWSWTLALLGLGQRFLNVDNRLRAYANEAVLPFYILHHTIIYIIGFYVIQSDSGVGIKFLLISSVSITVIFGIYELSIKKVNILRTLFGMKPI